MDGRWTDGGIFGSMDQKMTSWTDGWTNKWIEGNMDKWRDKERDGWMVTTLWLSSELTEGFSCSFP